MYYQELDPEIGILLAMLGQAYDDARQLSFESVEPPDLEFSPTAIQQFLDCAGMHLAEDVLPIENYIERIRRVLKRNPLPQQGILELEF